MGSGIEDLCFLTLLCFRSYRIIGKFLRPKENKKKSLLLNGLSRFSFMSKRSWKFSTTSVQILTRAKCKPFLNLLLAVSRYTRWPWAIDTENIVCASFSLLISPTWRNLTIVKLLTLWHCDKTRNSENNYFFCVRTCCISFKTDTYVLSIYT